MDEVAFGRYRLIALIGEGAMGKVYKAHDTTMGRDVAVKVLAPELATEAGYEERFRREAHTAARLAEPHIIPIYEAACGTSAGFQFGAAVYIARQIAAKVPTT